MKLGGTGFASMTQRKDGLLGKKTQCSRCSSKSKLRKMQTAAVAAIPTELSSCVADYAERITEKESVA